MSDSHLTRLARKYSKGNIKEDKNGKKKSKEIRDSMKRCGKPKRVQTEKNISTLSMFLSFKKKKVYIYLYRRFRHVRA
jgi:hypothetical protein